MKINFYNSTRILITVLMALISSSMKGQTSKIDSLRTLLYSEHDDAKKSELLFNICQQHYSLPSDSLLMYVKLGMKVSSSDPIRTLQFENFRCICLVKTGKQEEAIVELDSLLKVAGNLKNSDKVKFEIIQTRCSALIRNSQYRKAIEDALDMLQLSEQVHDTVSVLRAYRIIGWANMEMEKYVEAIKWLNKGINYTSNEKLLESACNLFSNIASCYNNIAIYDSAFYNISLALKYSRSTENLTIIANSLNIRAAMYMSTNDFVSAEKDLTEALKTREQMDDELYIISDMGELSFFYSMTHQYDKGIEVAKRGISIARKANSISKLIFLYKALASNYRFANRQGEYASALSTIIDLKDSLYKKNSEDALAVLNSKYELQKKENTIITQKYYLIRSRATTFGLIALFIVSIIVGRLLYKNYQQKDRIKMAAALSEQKRLAEEAVRNAEENERKRIAADLHDNLGSYAAAITSNVKNLKDGISDRESIMFSLDDNAQSMVTQLSDTIWVLKNEHLPITKLADRFKVWMLRLMQNYPAIKYHYSENISNDVEFTPAKILQIFLILKECVNNALKHSKGTDIRINFLSDEYWTISIEDNGVGFDKNTPPKGNGIGNVRSRATASGWNVEWQCVNPNGTRVIINNHTTK